MLLTTVADLVSPATTTLILARFAGGCTGVAITAVPSATAGGLRATSATGPGTLRTPATLTVAPGPSLRLLTTSTSATPTAAVLGSRRGRTDAGANPRLFLHPTEQAHLDIRHDLEFGVVAVHAETIEGTLLGLVDRRARAFHPFHRLALLSLGTAGRGPINQVVVVVILSSSSLSFRRRRRCCHTIIVRRRPAGSPVLAARSLPRSSGTLTSFGRCTLRRTLPAGLRRCLAATLAALGGIALGGRLPLLRRDPPTTLGTSTTATAGLARLAPVRCPLLRQLLAQ